MERGGRLVRWFSVVVMMLVLGSVPAYAQGSLTGVVKDTSGAVLPGVTVEAASPALIEKVRSVVTDSTGQYRIVDLRPGIYSVTFTLTGFSAVKREDVELTGSFTATVNADLRVGTVAETITVRGEAPIVDVQSATRQQVLTGEMVSEVPTARSYNALVVLVPGIMGGQTDIAQGPCRSCVFSIHGGRRSEGRVDVDGIRVSVPQAGSTNYFTDSGSAAETQITTSGGLGEAETGGPVLNVIPKTGGNTYTGMLFAGGANSAMQGDNITQELKDAGLTAPGDFIKTWDVSGNIGGPIKRDRLWYFFTGRTQGYDQYVVNLYHNKNVGNPNAWTYAPDLDRQANFDRMWENLTLRLTTQISPRNKINLFWDEQWQGRKSKDGLDNSSTTSPEARGRGEFYPVRAQQVTYTSPATNRVLIDGGFGTYLQDWGWREKPGAPTHDLVRITEQCSAGCAANGNIPGLVYRSQNWARNFNMTLTWRASLSYVTGAHNMKFGYQGGHMGVNLQNFTNSTNLAYRVNNGVPNQVTMVGDALPNRSRTRYTALYAQEQFTSGRLTLQGAVRYDRDWSYADPQQVGPVRFIPTPISFPKTALVDGYNDITPRFAASYDLFGTGKTALKVNAGKYLEAAIVGGIYSSPNPVATIVTNAARTWTDANGNWQPDCDLFNPGTQDLRAGGGDFCGVWSNPNFGKAAPSTRFDPALLSGWGVRPSDWNIGVGIQHEVLPRVSVDVTYHRRWFQNFLVTDNQAVTAADFTPFSITAPRDPRLPDGGGYVVSGLYDVVPSKFGQFSNYVTRARNFGEQYHRYQGVDINISARPRGGLTFQGGASIGQTVDDNCELRAALPEISPLNPYCHVASGYLTQVKGLATYTIPRLDVQVSGTFQSNPGIQLGAIGDAVGLAANWVVPNAVVAQTLGRNLSGNLTNVTVNLIPTGTQYFDRVNDVDLRFAKIFRFGRTRTNVGLDLYNAFNASPVLTSNTAFIPGGAWLIPNAVLSGRQVRVNARFDF